MITQDTAARIAYAYADIKAAKEILAVIEEAARKREEPDFRDAFGRHRSLELGVPSSMGGHRIYQVSHQLAAIVVRAHIDDRTREIEALCEKARGELQARGE